MRAMGFTAGAFVALLLAGPAALAAREAPAVPLAGSAG